MLKAKPDTRITFTHGRAQFRVQPQNAQRVRDALFTLDHAKPSKPKVGKSTSTDYPVFTPGMTTAEYIKQFQTLNGTSGGDPAETKRKRLSFTHAQRPAAMLDLLVPEIIEEPDPDYVAPTKSVKSSAGTTVVAALREKVAALEAEVAVLRQQLTADLA